MKTKSLAARLLILGLFTAMLVAMGLGAVGCSKKTGDPSDIIEQTDGQGDGRDGSNDGSGNGDNGGVDVTDMDGVPTELADVFFEYDMYELPADMRRVLQGNARYLKAHSSARLTLEGHCDERGTNEYNLALGQRRAEAVKDYLVDLGVEASRLQTISYGEERPFEMGQNESAWRQNRRVHFRTH